MSRGIPPPITKSWTYSQRSLGHGAQGSSHMLGGPSQTPARLHTVLCPGGALGRGNTAPSPAAAHRQPPPPSLIMPCCRLACVSPLRALSWGHCPHVSPLLHPKPRPLSSPHTPGAQGTSRISVCLEGSTCVGLLHKFIREQDMPFSEQKANSGGFPLMEHKCTGVLPPPDTKYVE